ncbi:hypothetical protein [Arsenicibacter rosenii]|uniref:Ig-like domain-containing protein n=1 Tax=Arsenicibacter rosenii TaxID=1750698 RepID=A0A1S2VH93_9BACT|nr:hypothetical protein [Arsenicibacter rosenii]OIN58102.1 hypothetical protein BLX24_16380 [Arsenicibacter rosenii]
MFFLLFFSLDAYPQTYTKNNLSQFSNPAGQYTITVNGCSLLCGYSVSNASAVASTTLTDFATINISGISLLTGITSSVRVKLQSSTVSKAGDYAGLVIGTGSTLNVNLFNAMSMKTYKGGVKQDDVSSSQLLSLDLLGLLGNTQREIAFKTTKDFDEVELVITGSSLLGLSLFNSVEYYYAFGGQTLGTFAFNCGSASTSGIFVAGTPSSGTLTVPVTGSTSGIVSLSVTGTGFTSVPLPYTTTITNGQTSIPVPLTFTGAGSAGTRVLTVASSYTSASGPGSCTAQATVYLPATITILSPASGSQTYLTPAVNGTANAGASVTVLAPGNPACVVTASGAGSWTCTSLSLSPGPVTVTAVVTTIAGTASATVSFTALNPPCSTPSALTVTPVSASLNIGSITDFSATGGSPGTISWSVNPATGLSPATSGTGTTTGGLIFAGAGSFTLTFIASNSSSPASCTTAQSVTATAIIVVTDPYAIVSVKVLLGGAYEATADLMRDDLRSRNLIPMIEPYSSSALVGTGFTHTGGGGGEMTTSSVLSTTGNDAVVDWVFLELRAPGSSSTVIATQSAFVQRDGDVVARDGVSAVPFAVGAGNYYVAVRHRNHLGVMTATALTLSSTAVTVDFTSPSVNTYGAQAQRLIGTTNKRVLWAGNAGTNRSVIYQGANNDTSLLLAQVQLDGGNVDGVLTYIVSKYLSGDLNMDGRIISQGPSNDLQTLFLNVLLHPDNGSSSLSHIIQEQLP